MAFDVSEMTPESVTVLSTESTDSNKWNLGPSAGPYLEAILSLADRTCQIRNLVAL